MRGRRFSKAGSMTCSAVSFSLQPQKDETKREDKENRRRNTSRVQHTRSKYNKERYRRS